LDDVIEQDKLIDRYVQENNRGAAVKMLVELILQKARERNFERAEYLRDKLLEVDPMAVNEIVKTGEVIEAEKSNAIDKDHLDIWADFYENLTPEEINALFYSMKCVEHPANHLIYKQGDKNSCLYFINKGRLKMFFRHEEKAGFLQTLKPGDVFGEDTFFFSEAFCSTSVITDSPVKLYVLFKDRLDQLYTISPGLESKLNDYCSSLESVADLIKAKNLERRIDKRLKLPGKISVKAIDDTDPATVAPFRAELLDITVRGLSFLMKTTEKISTLLLGRNLDMELTFEELGSDMAINCAGSVVAVNSEPFHEYAVHVDFIKNLAPGVIDDLADLLENAED
jgi:CRP-like cAMP-binding protein